MPKQTQPNGNPYNEEFAIPSAPKVKTDVNRMLALESKIDLLTKLFFEKGIKSPDGRIGLFLGKKLIYSNNNFQVELVNNSFFTPNSFVDIRFSISSKTTDDIYFSKRFRVECNNTGSFKRTPLIMTTLNMSKKGNYADMILSVVAVDLSSGTITYLQDVII